MKPVKNTLCIPKVGDRIRCKEWVTRHHEYDYYVIGKVEMKDGSPLITLRDWAVQYLLTNLELWEWI